jgi:hypothetical protein
MPHLLTPWERDFLASIGTRRRMTPKQADRLDQIRTKLRAHDAGRRA